MTKTAMVISAHPRKGWVVATRDGDIIRHQKLGAPVGAAEQARVEAQDLLGPDFIVLVPSLGERP